MARRPVAHGQCERKTGSITDNSHPIIFREADWVGKMPDGCWRGWT